MQLSRRLVASKLHSSYAIATLKIGAQVEHIASTGVEHLLGILFGDNGGVIRTCVLHGLVIHGRMASTALALVLNKEATFPLAVHEVQVESLHVSNHLFETPLPALLHVLHFELLLSLRPFNQFFVVFVGYQQFSWVVNQNVVDQEIEILFQVRNPEVVLVVSQEVGEPQVSTVFEQDDLVTQHVLGQFLQFGSNRVFVKDLDVWHVLDREIESKGSQFQGVFHRKALLVFEDLFVDVKHESL